MTRRPLVLKHLAVPRPGLAVAIIALAIAGSFAFAALDGGFGLRSFALVAGVAFGVALQRGELSLVRAWRDLMMLRDSGQLLGFLAALAVAALLTLGTLAGLGLAPPANARIGPVDWLLPIAGFVFGVGSVIARGGVMVHLRRISEGSLVAAPALLAVFAGFVLALAHWRWTFEAAIEHAPTPWLPDSLGLAGALAAQLATIAVLVAALWRWRPKPAASGAGFMRRVLIEPWPATAAGALLGVLVAASYAAGEPLGLIAECATVARWLATALGLAPDHLPGLDTGIAGLVVPRIEGFALTHHVVIIVGFVVGAFACAVGSGRFSLTGVTARECVEMLVGGIMLGWGAMTALGAVTGEAIAGVAVGAVSGWVFLASASLGIIVTLKLMGDPSAASQAVS
ncbi:YeeE/YedE thiosulfate transporter family protein [Methylopila henanensis]|uniref:YeeE/YedE thiosulfate transporter family protein n=1 Tax=Methylopila henanensis TaxID=873516 RepID=A0ABW4KBP8_9HYPH